jgi:hypothetical protein
MGVYVPPHRRPGWETPLTNFRRELGLPLGEPYGFINEHPLTKLFSATIDNTLEGRSDLAERISKLPPRDQNIVAPHLKASGDRETTLRWAVANGLLSLVPEVLHDQAIVSRVLQEPLSVLCLLEHATPHEGIQLLSQLLDQCDQRYFGEAARDVAIDMIVRFFGSVENKQLTNPDVTGTEWNTLNAAARKREEKARVIISRRVLQPLLREFRTNPNRNPHPIEDVIATTGRMKLEERPGWLPNFIRLLVDPKNPWIPDESNQHIHSLSLNIFRALEALAGLKGNFVCIKDLIKMRVNCTERVRPIRDKIAHFLKKGRDVWTIRFPVIDDKLIAYLLEPVSPTERPEVLAAMIEGMSPVEPPSWQHLTGWFTTEERKSHTTEFNRLFANPKLRVPLLLSASWSSFFKRGPLDKIAEGIKMMTLLEATHFLSQAKTNHRYDVVAFIYCQRPDLKPTDTVERFAVDLIACSEVKQLYADSFVWQWMHLLSLKGYRECEQNTQKIARIMNGRPGFSGTSLLSWVSDYAVRHPDAPQAELDYAALLKTTAEFSAYTETQ